MKRYQIVAKVRRNQEKIKSLNSENKELNRQYQLLSDKKQQYREEVETVGRGKRARTALIGRVYWKEWFKDEDRPNYKGICIERSEIIKVDGEFINGI